MTAWYNDPDPIAAEWLRRLIAAGYIADGVVDERDIRDVAPIELVGFTQCHFFAGIGVWSYALRRAGWPDDRPIWTGSCPCQPFSSAGAGGGFNDERHLWPHWHWLIQQGRPGVVLGEQVASKDGLWWHDLVSDDLDGIGYTSGAVIIGAAGFGLDWKGSAESKRLERAIRLCPDPMVGRHMAAFAEWADQALGFGGAHIRERQYFVGLADQQSRGRGVSGNEALTGQGRHPDGSGGASDRLVDGERAGLQGLGEYEPERHQSGWNGPLEGRSVTASSSAGRMGLAERERSDRSRNTGREKGSTGGRSNAAGHAASSLGQADDNGGNASTERSELNDLERSDADHAGAARRGTSGVGGQDDRGDRTGADHSIGGDLDWLLCRDGQWRPVGPGTFPLVAKAAGRVGRLRGYGNSLDAETAVAFCESIIEIIGERNAEQS